MSDDRVGIVIDLSAPGAKQVLDQLSAGITRTGKDAKSAGGDAKAGATGFDALGKSEEQAGRQARDATGKFTASGNAAAAGGKKAQAGAVGYSALGRSMDTARVDAVKFAGAYRTALDARTTRRVDLLGLGLVGVGAAAVGVAASFDKTMSGVKAYVDSNESNLARLREGAIEAGAATIFTAKDAAQAEIELGKVGLSTANILGGALRGSMSLAAAGELDMASAAKIGAVTMTQFGLKGKDFAHIADVLAAGAGKSATDVSSLSMALGYVGPVAAQMNVSLEESVGTLALLSQGGLDAERSGTGLRGVLGAMTSPSKAASKEMKRLNIELYDGKGRFKGVAAMAGELRKGLTHLTDKQRDHSLGVMFGNQQVTAARLLYKAGEKDVRKWTKAVDDQGYAQEQASTLTDNLAGDLEQLKGAIETALIKSGSSANDVLRTTVKVGAGVVGVVKDMPAPILAAGAAVTVLSGAYLLMAPRMAAMRTASALTRIEMLMVEQQAGKTAAAVGTSRGVGLLGSLGMLGGLGGPLALATAGVVAGTIAWNAYQGAQANAKADADNIRATFKKGTAEIGKNTKALIENKLAATLSTAEIGSLATVGITPGRMADSVIKGGKARAAMTRRMNLANQWAIGHQDSLMAGAVATARKETGFQDDALATALAGAKSAKERKKILADAKSGKISNISMKEMEQFSAKQYGTAGTPVQDLTLAMQHAKMQTDDPVAQKHLAGVEANTRLTADRLSAINPALNLLGQAGQVGSAPFAAAPRDGAKAAGDTSYSRARGTLSKAALIAAGGQYRVSNMFTGGGSGDHEAGRAVDVVGANLGRLVTRTRDAGGFAELHGVGPGRHAHLVPAGDTSYSRSGSSSGSTMVNLQMPVTVIGRIRPEDIEGFKAHMDAHARAYWQERKERA